MKKKELMEKLKDFGDDVDIDDQLPVKEVVKEVEKEVKVPEKLYSFTAEQFDELMKAAFERSREKSKEEPHNGEVFI